ncbi:5'-nucleotidase [Nocardioides sp. CGMCC 1.13656]|uniref:5'-nucleotidase n=1 Tax=Nocardioides TaxID=1839 RepID=UPI0015EB59AC|nr:5'-nucleotidase [Nocardioides sp. CGMCC 1.13656]MBA2954137.1 5'-nucleotidase [Nocardioides sp. CGMCC 1.13656]
MPYTLDNRLVVGVASSALFDLAESDRVLRRDGEQAYRRYQEEHLQDPLQPGIAFSFIRRLLSLNDLADDADHLVEVIVMSRNDPDTGLRVMESIAHHGLPITRAIFMQGRAPFAFVPALNVSLFVSADDDMVRSANQRGLPAGRALPSATVDDDDELRIAFDFDGILADDRSEQVKQESGLPELHHHGTAHAGSAHDPGPLQPFLLKIAKIQATERERKLADPDYRMRLHIALVTARHAPSHKRAIQSLKSWGVMVNDAFFLGGIDKGAVISVLRPHIYFDDRQGHLASTSTSAPAVQVPFGTVNGAPEHREANGVAGVDERVVGSAGGRHRAQLDERPSTASHPGAARS